MKFFRREKANSSYARRSARWAMLRLRRWGLFASLFAVAGAAGLAGYHTGSFQKAVDWTSAAGVTFTSDAGYRLKSILVTGRVHAPAGEILSRLGIREGMPIFGLRMEEAQKSLSGISWIKNVSISRQLPDTVLIRLEERVPAALWQYQKKISVIDEEGIVLTSDDVSLWRTLPLVVGEDAQQHVAELSALLKAEPLIGGELESAARIKNRRWDLHLKNGIVVKLPEQDSELALRRLAQAQEQKNILGRSIASIDLRQPEKLLVTLLAQNSGEDAPGGAAEGKKAGI